jgi:hypothetical protein
MAITKATSSVLADNAALNNLNAGASIALTKPVSVSGNLTVDTNTLFVDATNDRVGIGTATPTSKLHVAGDGNFSEDIYINSGGATGGLVYVGKASNSANYAGLWMGSNVSTHTTSNYSFLSDGNDTFFNAKVGRNVYFRIGNGTHATLDSSGNFGIGTTTPSAKLHAVGSLRVDNGSTAGALNFGADVQATTRSSDVRKLAAIVSPDYANTRNIEWATSDSSSAAANLVSIGGRVGGSNYAATAITLATAPNVSTTGGTAALHIDSSQRVGIGTTTPYSTLGVNGNLATMGTGKGLLFYNLVGTGEYAGNFEMMRFMPVSNTYLIQSLTGGTGQHRNLQFSIGNATMLLDAGNGNVGIGTTTASERLTVSGNISATGNITCTGHLAAATKSFKIPHQTKAGYLQYGVVESNEHSVYVRGKTSDDTIILPDHWDWLVESDSVTVTLTPYGSHQPLYIISADNKKVVVGGAAGEYHYVVYGTRKDVEALVVETEE